MWDVGEMDDFTMTKRVLAEGDSWRSERNFLNTLHFQTSHSLEGPRPREILLVVTVIEGTLYAEIAFFVYFFEPFNPRFYRK